MGKIGSIKVEGIDEVVRELERRQGNLREALEAIVLAGGEVIRQAAISRSDGKIAANMTKEPISKSAKRIEVGIGPSRREWYARLIETGTGAHTVKRKRAKALNIGQMGFRALMQHPGMKARPFLRPALDENGDAAQAAIADEAKKALDL